MLREGVEAGAGRVEVGVGVGVGTDTDTGAAGPGTGAGAGAVMVGFERARSAQVGAGFAWVVVEAVDVVEDTDECEDLVRSRLLEATPPRWWVISLLPN